MEMVVVSSGACSRCGRKLDGVAAYLQDDDAFCEGCLTRPENLATAYRIWNGLQGEFRKLICGAIPTWESLDDLDRNEALTAAMEDPEAGELRRVSDLLTDIGEMISTLEQEPDPR